MMSVYNDPNYRNYDLKKIETTGDDVEMSGTKNAAINEYDAAFLKYLVRMGDTLSKNTLDLSEIKSNVEALESLKKYQEHEYLHTLVNPEKTRGAKLPSTIPIPSSSFQLKQSINLTTNASGAAAVIFNPFFLDSAGTNSTFFVNNNAALNGNSTSNFFTATSIGQVIPAVYNQYRLVSASIVCKYFGRLDNVQGVVGGSIIFDQNIIPTAAAAVNANLAKYGDFNLAQDAFFWQEHYCLSGIRELYFPIDNQYEQYANLGTSRNGFGFLLYILGAPPSTAVFKLDAYLNFECLPDVTFLNYIPTSISNCPSYGKEDAVRAVQARPIMKEQDYSSSDLTKRDTRSDFWGSIAAKFGNLLPSLKSIAEKVLPQLGEKALNMGLRMLA